MLHHGDHNFESKKKTIFMLGKLFGIINKLKYTIFKKKVISS
jgi:hypothetical protein